VNNLLLIIIFLVACSTNTKNSSLSNHLKMCTQEAKQCPDGSYVTRDSTINCNFKKCPK